VLWSSYLDQACRRGLIVVPFFCVAEFQEINQQADEARLLLAAISTAAIDVGDVVRRASACAPPGLGRFVGRGLAFVTHPVVIGEKAGMLMRAPDDAGSEASFWPDRM
jgi:hypothetical protein